MIWQAMIQQEEIFLQNVPELYPPTCTSSNNLQLLFRFYDETKKASIFPNSGPERISSSFVVAFLLHQMKTSSLVVCYSSFFTTIQAVCIFLFNRGWLWSLQGATQPGVRAFSVINCSVDSLKLHSLKALSIKTKNCFF